MGRTQDLSDWSRVVAVAARSGDLAECHANNDIVSNDPDLLDPKTFFEMPV